MTVESVISIFYMISNFFFLIPKQCLSIIKNLNLTVTFNIENKSTSWLYSYIVQVLSFFPCTCSKGDFHPLIYKNVIIFSILFPFILVVLGINPQPCLTSELYSYTYPVHFFKKFFPCNSRNFPILFEVYTKQMNYGLLN